MKTHLLLLPSSHLLVLCSSLFAADPAAPSNSDLLKDLNRHPRLAVGTSVKEINKSRESRVLELFREAANNDPDALITLETVHEAGHLHSRPLEISNVVAFVKGSIDDSLIVVGAHLDKVEEGEGIIDDWSGSVTVINLYKHFSRNRPQHSMLFVSFAYEEDGLWGSKSFVNQMRRDGVLSRVRSMINLECLGVSQLFVWENGSTPGLTRIAQSVAADLGIPIEPRELHGVGADSVPFTKAGIPAITFDSLAEADFSKIHSANDTINAIDPSQLMKAFAFARHYVEAVDNVPNDSEILAFEAPRTRLPDTAYRPSRRAAKASHDNAAVITEGDAKSAISTANEEWAEAVCDWSQAIDASDSFNAKAASNRFLALYSADCVVLPPDGLVLRDREQLRRYFEELARSVRSVRLITDRIDTPVSQRDTDAPSLVYEYGHYEILLKTDDVVRTGRSVVAWRLLRSPDAPGGYVARFHWDLWYPHGAANGPKAE